MRVCVCGRASQYTLYVYIYHRFTKGFSKAPFLHPEFYLLLYTQSYSPEFNQFEISFDFNCFAINFTRFAEYSAAQHITFKGARALLPQRAYTHTYIPWNKLLKLPNKLTRNGICIFKCTCDAMYRNFWQATP